LRQFEEAFHACHFRILVFEALVWCVWQQVSEMGILEVGTSAVHYEMLALNPLTF